MATVDGLPTGWQVWYAEDDGRVVLAYRPDIFDGTAFPPSCMPTATVAPGPRPDARPEQRARRDEWHVALYLEPDVRLEAADASFPTRAAAVDHLVGVARSFDAGEFEYQAAYIEPPVTYLDRLDELTGEGK